MDNNNLKDACPNSTFQQKLQDKISEVNAFVHLLPAVTIIHKCSDFTVEYMSQQGLDILGVTMEELRSMGAEYYERFFNKEDADDYVPKMFHLMESNQENEMVSFFHQVRQSPEHDWTWYLCCTKILLRDDNQKPTHLISLVFPIDEKHHLTSKIVRLTEEKLFLQRHYQEFSKLTKKEKEILKLMALGKTTNEISDLLFISPNTAETHRKNIRLKLHISSTYDISQYALAFDLI